MVTVTTKRELNEAMKSQIKRIRIVGPFAEEIAVKLRRNKKIKKGGLLAGGALLAAGIIAAPFSGGTSLMGSAAGLGMMGLSVGTITLTATELAILCGTAISFYGIYKGAKVKIHDPATGNTFVDIDATNVKN